LEIPPNASSKPPVNNRNRVSKIKSLSKIKVMAETRNRVSKIKSLSKIKVIAETRFLPLTDLRTRLEMSRIL